MQGLNIVRLVVTLLLVSGVSFANAAQVPVYDALSFTVNTDFVVQLAPSANVEGDFILVESGKADAFEILGVNPDAAPSPKVKSFYVLARPKSATSSVAKPGDVFYNNAGTFIRVEARRINYHYLTDKSTIIRFSHSLDVDRTTVKATYFSIDEESPQGSAPGTWDIQYDARLRQFADLLGSTAASKIGFRYSIDAGGIQMTRSPGFTSPRGSIFDSISAHSVKLRYATGNYASTAFGPPSCYDSDGGKNLFSKGSIAGNELSWNDAPYNRTKFEDLCIDFGKGTYGQAVASCSASDDCKVDEYYCKDDKIYYEYIECQYGCSNGACLSSASATPAVTQQPAPKPVQTCKDYVGDGSYNLCVGFSATSRNGAMVKVSEVSSSFGATYASLDVSATDGATQRYTGLSQGKVYEFGKVRVFVDDLFSGAFNSNGYASVRIESIEATPTVQPEDELPPFPGSEPVSFSVELQPGWNMFSVPIYDYASHMVSSQWQNYPVEIAESNCGEPSSIWQFDSSTKQYSKAGKLSEGTRLNAIYGYWTKARSACTLKFEGTAKIGADSLYLQRGWNLASVPYGGFEAADIAEQCTVLSGPWVYSAGSKSFEKPDKLGEGAAYFVKVASDCWLGDEEGLPPLPNDLQANIAANIARGESREDSVEPAAETVQAVEATAISSGTVSIQRTEVSTTGRPARGASNAKVKIVAFQDFECPFCSRAHSTLLELLKEYGGKIAYYTKHFPLPFHANAQNAAEAYECALEQGADYAFKLEDSMLANQQALQLTDLKGYAKAAGLSSSKFDSCLDSGSKKGVVDAMYTEAQALGVSGTPTFYVNGRQLVGAQPISSFRQIIDEELAAS